MRRGQWTAAQDQQLALEVQLNGLKWTCIRVDNKSARQCRERWVNYLSPQIKRHPWHADDDNLLAFLVAIYGSRWCRILPFFSQRSYAQVKQRATILKLTPTKAQKKRDMKRDVALDLDDLAFDNAIDTISFTKFMTEFDVLSDSDETTCGKDACGEDADEHYNAVSEDAKAADNDDTGATHDDVPFAQCSAHSSSVAAVPPLLCIRSPP